MKSTVSAAPAAVILALLLVAAAPAAYAQIYTDWATPQNLTNLNSAAADA